jgi:hypothetical protein
MIGCFLLCGSETQRGERLMPTSPFQFDLADAKPSISEYGNTIREANQNSFPALAGNGVPFS